MKFTYRSGEQPLQGYTLRRGLGRGGFGEVYLAVSDGGKEVALKLVQRHLNVELRGVGQCLNLKHPHLVTLYDIRKAENDDNWIVMEYVAGETLDPVLARHPQGMPEQEGLVWLQGIGDGVAHRHDHGLGHRDLKPGNLFLENGVVKIGDYGLSKFISVSRRSGQTESVGTVHYTAPEMSLGRYGKEVDQYALGIILYEMLTGTVPFDGESPGEILMKHLTAVPDLGALAEPYRSVVARLLDKDPQRRYPSVQDLLAALPNLAPVRPGVSTTSHHPADHERGKRASAGKAGAKPEPPGPGRPNGAGFDKAGLLRILVEHGMEAEDIERILHTLGEYPKPDLPGMVKAVQILVENGMEASDIERVLHALGDHPKQDSPVLVGVLQGLVEHGMEAEDIERVLHALGEHPEQDLPGKVAALQSPVENWMEAEDIERLLHALGEYPKPDLPGMVKAVQILVENGMEASDIERALRAFGAHPK